ncbi:MAG: CMP-N-acetylneuraminic acid synthetase [Nitrospira sp.]|nr:CMP-N-acetylneuraminic acid synthetase [Nitrospira sp.]
MMHIGPRRIGPGQPVYIVAEACDNHLGDLAVAKEMVRTAKLAGADAIKFQHHLPDEEMLPDIPMSDNFQEPLYEFLKKHALRLADHEALMRTCEAAGIQYLCTPFSYKAAAELNELGVPAFKIGSGEMTDIPSLRKIARFKKPMILSTGMCTLEEIDDTAAALRQEGASVALLNCVSEYPPVYEDINLGVIRTMQTRYPDLAIGHSDHTPDLYTCYAAVTLGACIIEKHVILDKLQPGPDQSVSIDMAELHELVCGIRKIEKAMGSEKRVHSREGQIREWAFRSVVALTAIEAGQTITPDMVWTKRPGTGIPSKRLPDVIGKTARKRIAPNTLLRWEDLQ